MKTGKESKVSLEKIYEEDFEQLFNLKVSDMTAYNEFFKKND